MTETQTFLVYRKKPDEEQGRYVRYEVPKRKGMTILEAVFYIQDHLDSSLAFRYSCRGAICGSCGMTVDKVPELACRTQVASVKTKKKPVKLPEFHFGDHSGWDEENEILIEPLPNMRIIKDLIVDMEPFWNFYRKVEPYFTREWKDTAPESHQSHEAAKSIEHLINCIACGLCWACPVNAKNAEYYGPMALAKADRFVADNRLSEKHREEILSKIWQENAVPACEKLFVCNRVCPKGVQPGTAINDIRQKWSKNE